MFITVGLHRRISYLKNLAGQVAPQALPDAYETTKFLFRSDWTLAASGSPHIKELEDQLKVLLQLPLAPALEHILILG